MGIKQRYDKLKSKVGLFGVVMIGMVLVAGVGTAIYFVIASLVMNDAEFSITTASGRGISQTIDFELQAIDTSDGPVIGISPAEFSLTTGGTFNFEVIELQTLVMDPSGCNNGGLGDCNTQLYVDDVAFPYTTALNYPTKTDSRVMTVGPHTMEVRTDCAQFTCDQTRSVSVTVNQI